MGRERLFSAMAVDEMTVSRGVSSASPGSLEIAASSFEKMGAFGSLCTRIQYKIRISTLHRQVAFDSDTGRDGTAQTERGEDCDEDRMLTERFE